MIVHFICRGNVHRSVIAEAYLKSLKLRNVDVMSSGTVADAYRVQNEPILIGVTKRLEKYGIGGYAKARCDQLTQARTERGDITVCMNQIVSDEFNTIASKPSTILTWDVTDSGEGQRIILPGEDGYKYFEEVYKEITDNVDVLVAEEGLSAL